MLKKKKIKVIIFQVAKVVNAIFIPPTPSSPHPKKNKKSCVSRWRERGGGGVVSNNLRPRFFYVTRAVTA
jgi:hypothetical protein